MKTTCVMGIILVMAATAACGMECNGPILVPGSTVDTCGSCSTNPPGCPGSTIVRNDYYRCGGTGYYGCDSGSGTVGYNNLCIVTPNFLALALLWSAYEDCQRDKNRNHPWPTECVRGDSPTLWCAWNTCSAGTSGGTPITATVLTGLGSEGCYLANRGKPSSEIVAARASVR